MQVGYREVLVYVCHNKCASTLSAQIICDIYTYVHYRYGRA